MKSGPKPRPIVKRFWEKVKKSDGCWEWTAYCLADGYGQFFVQRGEQWLAHRFSWVLHFGPIPIGEGYHGTCVLHRCDNPKCVRPNHLWLGSNADNIRDCQAKGRASKVRAHGERHPMAKLTAKQIPAIRQDTRTLETIARNYGVCLSTISSIRRREHWQHVA